VVLRQGSLYCVFENGKIKRVMVLVIDIECEFVMENIFDVLENLVEIVCEILFFYEQS
jgi:hypothetical protein